MFLLSRGLSSVGWGHPGRRTHRYHIKLHMVRRALLLQEGGGGRRSFWLLLGGNNIGLVASDVRFAKPDG